MGKCKEFYFPSSDGKTRIHAMMWLPEGSPVAVLQIAHGVAEYALRYAPFADYLCERGFAVAANDHIGHGQSVAEGAPPLYFGEADGWRHVVDDLFTLRGRVRALCPAVPCFLLGHSMGSFLARSDLIRYPGTVDGAILMGTGQQNGLMLALGRLAATLIGKRRGFDRFDPTVHALAFGAYNKPFAPTRTDYDWLSVNRENVDRYIADPLCGGDATVGLFLDMLGGISFQQKRANLDRMDKTTPVLFISGAMDPVGNLSAGVRRAYRSFLDAGMRDVSIRLYPGLRHEILNETERKTVYADILAWLEAHM